MRRSSFFSRRRYDSAADGSESVKRKSGAEFSSKEISGTIDKKMRRITSSRLFKLERATSDFLSHLSARAYGMILISFGILALILHFIGLYPDRTLVNPIIALFCAVLSIPFLLSDKTLPIILQQFSWTDYIFFEFFCMKRMNKNEGHRSVPAPVVILLGVLLALCGMLAPLWTVIAAAFGVVFVYLSFATPEFAFFVSLMILPYSGYVTHSEIIFPCIVGLAVLSFLRKVAYGKRVIHFERYDLFLGLMLLFILISGVFVKGINSFYQSVEMIVMAMGYILASNIIANRRLADRMINTVIFSSTVPAMLSVIQLAAILWSADSGDEIFSRIDGILARTDGVAVYLLAALIFAISASRHNTGRSKAVYALAVVLNFLALIISGEIFALLALIISAFSFYVLRSNRRVWISLLLLLCVPYLILFLPNRYIDMLFLFVPSLSTADQLLSLWESCIAAIGNSPIFGIGMGAESFAAEMAKYGIEGLKNSGNLFIELGLEAGVFALISFLFVLFTRVSHRKKYFSYVRSSQVSTDSLVSEVCFFALIAYGCMNYIWSDISAYYLFWTVFGIGSATLRVAKKEHDDLVFYYKDTMAVDSSAIDVEIA